MIVGEKMAKAERLVELMITINAKRHFTVGELANEFGVSKRTILRDLQTLESIGFPLYSEVGAAGGYHVLRERILPPITFSENEAKAIFFAYQSVQFYRDLPFEEESLSVLKKFLNCLPTDVQHSITQLQNKIVFWTPDRHCDTPLLRELLEAVTNNYSVSMEYKSQYKKSVRTVIPIGLYASNGLWYCPAFCTLANEFREFRVDRIEKIFECKKYNKSEYTIPLSIHDYLEQLEVGNDFRLKIRLTNVGVKRCETEFLLARGLEVFSDGDGMIDLTIKEATLDWVADYFLSFGDNAIIIEPAELKTLLDTKIKVLYQHHCIRETSG